MSFLEIILIVALYVSLSWKCQYLYNDPINSLSRLTKLPGQSRVYQQHCGCCRSIPSQVEWPCNWPGRVAAQLTCNLKGVPYRRAKSPDDVDVPACHVLILSLKSVQCLYPACVATWYTFLIDNGSTLTGWRDQEIRKHNSQLSALVITVKYFNLIGPTFYLKTTHELMNDFRVMLCLQWWINDEFSYFVSIKPKSD